MPYQVVWDRCNMFSDDQEGAAETLRRGQRVPQHFIDADPPQIERLAVIGAIQFFEDPPAVPVVATAQQVNADLGTQPLPDNLEELSVEQLKQEASNRHVDLGDARRKEEIIARLRSGTA